MTTDTKMDTKHLKDSSEIAALITAEVRKYPGCDDLKIAGVLSKEPDAQGCNWTLGAIRATGIPQSIWEPALNKVLAQARKSYYLKPA